MFKEDWSKKDQSNFNKEGKLKSNRPGLKYYNYNKISYITKNCYVLKKEMEKANPII